jgi:diguanylate cyclase (GGDEF)-like protein
MTALNASQYLRFALIVSEALIIGILEYAVGSDTSPQVSHYISLDVFYCLPVIQAARLSAIHAARRHDSQVSTIVGVAVAFVWSTTEMALSLTPFPAAMYMLNIFTRSVVFTVIGRVVSKLWREGKQANKDLLTGLSTRMDFLEKLEIEQSRSERTNSPYSLLFIDIDRFKSMNEVYGHQVGDEVLKVLANILTDCSRKVDIAARLGGDNFALLLPDTDYPSCEIVIQRIEASTMRVFEERLWPISVSIGRTTRVGKSNNNADWVIQLADENMNEVKRNKQHMTPDLAGN